LPGGFERYGLFSALDIAYLGFARVIQVAYVRTSSAVEGYNHIQDLTIPTVPKEKRR
jgi:hypothetical protein